VSAIELAIVADGGENLGAGTITAEAWTRFNSGAVWCSLHDFSTRLELRLVVAGEWGVLELGEDRFVVPASAAPAWFWRHCGLWSTGPPGAIESDPAVLLDAVDAWAAGEPLDPGVPPATQLRLGLADELLRDELLFEVEGRWLCGRRFTLEDGPEAIVEPFSMKDLVLDLSRLLAIALAGD
jgi:hypothetical protein